MGTSDTPGAFGIQESRQDSTMSTGVSHAVPYSQLEVTLGNKKKHTRISR